MTGHRVTVKERRDAIRTRSSSAQVEQFLPLGARWSLLSLLGPTWDPDIVGPSFDIEMFYYSQAPCMTNVTTLPLIWRAPPSSNEDK